MKQTRKEVPMIKTNEKKLDVIDKELEKLESLLEELEPRAENAALFEAQLIEYMIENNLYELTIGDTIVSLEIDEVLDIDKMKEDGIYEDFLLKEGTE